MNKKVDQFKFKCSCGENLQTDSEVHWDFNFNIEGDVFMFCKACEKEYIVTWSPSSPMSVSDD